jgi:hypothetical protein
LYISASPTLWGSISASQKKEPLSLSLVIISRNLERGKEPFDTLEPKDRKARSDDVIALLHDIKPTLFSTVINKRRIMERYVNAYDPKSYAFRAMVDRFSKFLTRTDSVGYVVMDLEESRNDKNLQQLIHESRLQGISLAGWNYWPTTNSYLENITNTASFLPSFNSPGLQLADFCARKIGRAHV